MPGAAFHVSEIERSLASEQQTLEYALCGGNVVPIAVVRDWLLYVRQFDH